MPDGQSPDQFQYVKLPDGSYGKFAANATDDQIRTQITKDFPNAYKATTPQPQTFAERHPTVAAVGNYLGGALEGAEKGAEHTLGLYEPIPPDRAKRSAFYRFTHPIIPGTEDLAKPPETIPEKIGYGGEQAAEYLAPSGLEEAGSKALTKAIPALGRLAEPAARTAVSALSTGAINKLQGGSFTGGAEVGGGLGAAGEIGRAVAPHLAESALGVTKRLRGFDRTPGKAALEETKGIRPSSVGESARNKLAELTSNLESMAAGSTKPASTSSAVGVIDAEMQKAVKQNNKTLYNGLKDVRDQLTTEFTTGNPLPTQMSASQLLDIKRGIGDLEGNWNPDLRGKLKGIVRKVYNALDKELDNAVPGSDKINQRISSLIPVAQRAESVDRGAPLAQKLVGRLAAHTGALAGAGLGGILAPYYGQSPVTGAAAGLLLPELLASPAVEMVGARSLYSPVLPQLGRGFLPVGRVQRNQLTK